VLVGVVPLHLPHFLSLGASLALIAVYYWSLHQPSLMPLPAVLLIGLISDCFGGAPVGVGTLVLLLVHRLVTGQRRLLLGASFIVVWWAYMLVAAAATLVAWLSERRVMVMSITVRLRSTSLRSPGCAPDATRIRVLRFISMFICSPSTSSLYPLNVAVVFGAIETPEKSRCRGRAASAHVAIPRPHTLSQAATFSKTQGHS